ncbi:MAG TPA: PEP-CTERM sorting domain-containing protein [Gemmata sp.]|nr:PEP-CTERM sorting domain-containing protein [Gemmata sp.]
MRKLCAIWLSWAVAFAAILISSAPAQAFYWYGWPGSGIPPERTIVGPPGGVTGVPPRIPVGLPVVVTTPPPSGQTTPEPGTGLAALVGIGVLAVARALRRRSTTPFAGAL